jgi:hypothetical protein
MTFRPRFVRPWLVLTCSFAGSALAASGCSIETDADDDAQGGEGGADGAASGGSTSGGGLGGAGELPPGTTACDQPAACGLVECQAVELYPEHVEVCSELSPHTNPPTNGPHYEPPYWAQFGIYDEPIGDGFLLHGLEHSAVALLYNCDLVESAGGSCEDLVDELVAFDEAYPEDPKCTSVPHRLYVIPDPDLDVPFAATAWQGHLKGQCFDADRVREFVDDHYGQNYEDICYDGVDPLAQGCE